jgi:hypothetical protein
MTGNLPGKGFFRQKRSFFYTFSDKIFSFSGLVDCFLERKYSVIGGIYIKKKPLHNEGVLYPNNP